MSLDFLTAEHGLIFRIAHIDNLLWLLRNGLHCPSSDKRDPEFVAIGLPDVIDKRASKCVTISPGGVLQDYVPFYFTPLSVMLFNIVTGRGEVIRRSRDDIVILVSSLEALRSAGVRFVFTDRHALVAYAQFYSDINELGKIDWGLLKARDFKRSDADPGKMERYQAEVLAHREVPVAALLRVACYSCAGKKRAEAMIAEAGVDLKVIVKADWFFE
ncbi:MAG: type II toxin-antitoxin system toxin DNA ADP-ribosyl transferase DarT [Thermoleophilia bacterium]